MIYASHFICIGVTKRNAQILNCQAPCHQPIKTCTNMNCYLIPTYSYFMIHCGPKFEKQHDRKQLVCMQDYHDDGQWKQMRQSSGSNQVKIQFLKRKRKKLQSTQKLVNMHVTLYNAVLNIYLKHLGNISLHTEMLQ